MGPDSGYQQGGAARVPTHPRSSLACPSGALRAEVLRACPYFSLLVTVSYPYMYIHSYMYTARSETTQAKLQSKD